MSVNVNRGKKT